VDRAKPLDPDILEATMAGLEAGLRVAHIATFNLQMCDASEDAEKVLADPALKDFDAIPVRDRGRIVGALERGPEIASGTARSAMRPLDDAMLVSGDAPLATFLPVAAESTYRLVLSGPEIRGIVTRSDLHKLPVRLFAFALITHLEMTMANLIRTKRPEDSDWLSILTEGRQKKLRDKLEELRQKRIDPPPLELTEFCDKREIVSRICNCGPDFGKDLKKVEELRNSVAHAGSYAQDEDQVRAFVRRLATAKKWTDQLNGILSDHPRERHEKETD
jgi:hypothetical protein